MIDVFYAPREKVADTETALKTILSKYYGIENAVISRNEHGKPFLEKGEPFFSVSHTQELFFVAVASFPIGLDAEPKNREVEFLSICKKYPFFTPIPTATKEFLKAWTDFESAVKFLGGSLALDGKKLQKDDTRFHFLEFEIQEHFLCVCTGEPSEVRWIGF